jgi:hypothetical protein
MWFWRGSATGLLLGLLLWTGLDSWWKEGVLIMLGTGALIMITDVTRALRSPDFKRRVAS